MYSCQDHWRRPRNHMLTPHHALRSTHDALHLSFHPKPKVKFVKYPLGRFESVHTGSEGSTVSRNGLRQRIKNRTYTASIESHDSKPGLDDANNSDAKLK